MLNNSKMNFSLNDWTLTIDIEGCTTPDVFSPAYKWYLIH